MSEASKRSAAAIKEIRATHELYASGYLTEAARDAEIASIKSSFSVS